MLNQEKTNTQNQLIEVSCPVCNSKNAKLKYIIQNYKIHRCLNCSLVYLNPRPSDEWINQLYDEEYFEGKGFDQSVNYKNEFLNPSQRELALHQLKLNDISYLLYKTLKKKTGTFLDVGCGYGLFLKSAMNKEFKVEGIEICKEVAEFAQKSLGVKIYQGSALETISKLKSESYDVITMIEVLEHLPNPIAVLRECHRLLNPGGLLFIQTGNIDSLKAKMRGKDWDYFTLPGHICYYSPKSIKELLHRSNFYQAIICPPRLQHYDSKAFQWLKSKNIIDHDFNSRGVFSKIIVNLTNFALNSREKILSPGLFAYGIKS